MKDAHDTITPDLLPAPLPGAAPQRPPLLGDRAMTSAERKAAQRERERKAFITYARVELEAISTDALLDELGRLITAGRPALARAIWGVLEARACAARAVRHPDQEQLAADLARRTAE